MMVLPLRFGFCYIKTAQMCNIGWGGRFEDDSSTAFSLLDFLSLLFYISCRISSVVDWHCPGPITWQNASIKTVELQWGSLRITLEDAGSLQSWNQQVQLALTLARSLTFPVLLLQVLLCQNKNQTNMIKQHLQKLLMSYKKAPNWFSEWAYFLITFTLTWSI